MRSLTMTSVSCFLVLDCIARRQAVRFKRDVLVYRRDRQPASDRRTLFFLHEAYL